MSCISFTQITEANTTVQFSSTKRLGLPEERVEIKRVKGRNSSSTYQTECGMLGSGFLSNLCKKRELLIKGLPLLYDLDMAIKELCGY